MYHKITALVVSFLFAYIKLHYDFFRIYDFIFIFHGNFQGSPICRNEFNPLINIPSSSPLDEVRDLDV